MAFISLKQFLARMELATPAQFDEWNKAWRVALESGSQESLLGFISRERGLAEDVVLQKLAQALSWPYLDLAKQAVPAEALWTQNAITYSDPTRACGRNLPPFVTAASYMINLAIMKNHGAQGATLIAKNHFGTVHGLNHDAISPTAMGQSNPLVDILL